MLRLRQVLVMIEFCCKKVRVVAVRAKMALELSNVGVEQRIEIVYNIECTCNTMYRLR